MGHRRGVVAGFPTTTLPSTTRAFICPYPNEVVVNDYVNKDYLTLSYPPGGDEVLKGSGDELSLPDDGPQEILLLTYNVGFLELKFSVKYALSAKLTLTRSDLTTEVLEQPAARDAVSQNSMLIMVSHRGWARFLTRRLHGTSVPYRIIRTIQQNTVFIPTRECRW